MELSLSHKLKFSNPNIFATLSCNLWHFKLRIFNRTHSLKYLRSKTLDCKDKWIKKSEFEAKTQFLEILKTEGISTSYVNVKFVILVNIWTDPWRKWKYVKIRKNILTDWACAFCFHWGGLWPVRVSKWTLIFNRKEYSKIKKCTNKS